MQKLLETLGVSGAHGLIIPVLVTLAFGLLIGFVWFRVQKVIGDNAQEKIEAIDEHNSRVRTAVMEYRNSDF